MQRIALSLPMAISIFLCPYSNAFATSMRISKARAPSITSLLIYDNGPQWKLGDGIKLATGEQSVSCLSSTEPDFGPTGLGTGVVTSTSVTEVSSVTEYSNAMEMGAYAAVFGFGASATDSTSFSTQSQSNDQRAQLVIQVKVTGQIVRLKSNPEPSQDALQLLKIDPTGTLFASACGDAAVTAVEEGAQLNITFAFDSPSEDITSTVQNAITAAWGMDKASGNYQKTLQNISTALHLQIAALQAGGQNKSFSSLTDPSKIIEDARQFAQQVNAQNARPTRVYFTKYSNIPSFVVAQGKELLNFNGDYEVMTALVSAYQLAFDRQKLVAKALSTPNDFQGADIQNTAKLQAAEKALSSQAQTFSDAANECATMVQNGQPCESPANLDVEKLPDIQALPLCSPTALELSQDDGCKEKTRIGAACYCVLCQFSDSRQAHGKQTIINVCPTMPPKMNARVTYRGSIIGPTSNINGIPNISWWYALHLGKSAGDYDYSGNTQEQKFNNQEIIQIPAAPNTDLTTSILVTLCQTNSDANAMCIIQPSSDNAAFYTNVEIQDQTNTTLPPAN